MSQTKSIEEVEAWFLNDDSPTFEMIRDAQTGSDAFYIASSRLIKQGVKVNIEIIYAVVSRIRTFE